ncbi:MAG: glycosyltransferase [Bacteroidetes bacterium]|nr:MAG: glycosyltransferase [Bacteroidota bacterium]
MNKQQKVLIAALDWGLGHATRMFPIIEYFLDNNYQVALASSSHALILFQSRYKSLKCFELPTYNINYTSNSMVMNMITQLPKIKTTISDEKKKLDIILKEFAANLIISDNRYGIHHKNIPSVFITHQLQILPPNVMKIAKPILKALHKEMMSKFNQVWIPDFIGNNNLAGELSQISNPPKNIFYIGALSRFINHKIVNTRQINEFPTILVLLSGPEPARSDFEEIVLEQLSKYNGKSVVLRGLPDDENKSILNDITIYNHLNDSELLEVIKSSDIVISRSGYSTIMDLYFLGVKAVFVPTPGQTEQEYLAKNFLKESKFFYQKQAEFNIDKIISNYKLYSGFNSEESIYKNEISKALKQLN